MAIIRVGVVFYRACGSHNKVDSNPLLFVDWDHGIVLIF